VGESINENGFCAPNTMRAGIISLAITIHSVGALSTSEGLVRARERISGNFCPEPDTVDLRKLNQRDDAVRPGRLERLRRGAIREHVASSETSCDSAPIVGQEQDGPDTFQCGTVLGSRLPRMNLVRFQAQASKSVVQREEVP
jgi:hypothetical protein